MKPRDKLSNAIARGDFVFQRPPRPGEEKTFEEIFPTVQDIDIHVEETGRDLRRPRDDYFSNRFVPHVVDCTNPRCVKGGVILGLIIHEVIRENKTSFQDTKNCRGFEGSPKGRRHHGDCDHKFKIEVTVTYKPAIGTSS